MSSRVLRDPSGRVVAVVITTPLPGLEPGSILRVLGTEPGEDSFQFTGEQTGWPASAEEARFVRTVRERGPHNRWAEADRIEARRLQAEGLSWSQIADAAPDMPDTLRARKASDASVVTVAGRWLGIRTLVSTSCRRRRGLDGPGLVAP